MVPHKHPTETMSLKRSRQEQAQHIDNTDRVGAQRGLQASNPVLNLQAEPFPSFSLYAYLGLAGSVFLCVVLSFVCVVASLISLIYLYLSISRRMPVLCALPPNINLGFYEACSGRCWIHNGQPGENAVCVPTGSLRFGLETNTIGWKYRATTWEDSATNK